MNLNNILLRKKYQVYFAKGTEHNPLTVKALAANISTYGFALSPSLIKVLETRSVTDLKKINDFFMKNMANVVGSRGNFTPLFRNFPNDVPDTFEYFIERVNGHFASVFGWTENGQLLACGHIIDTAKFDMTNFGACPICQQQVDSCDLWQAKERAPLKQRTKMRTIDLCSSTADRELFKAMLSSNTSISQQDKEDIEAIFAEYNSTGRQSELDQYVPAEIPNKEVLAYFASLVLTHCQTDDILRGRLKTATDVLRLATAMSGGDISLATPSKFKKFSKKERRFFLSAIDGLTNNVSEDMLRHRTKWLRLGEILHPGEYKKRFASAWETFDRLRNRPENIITFNSQTEKFLEESKYDELLGHLKNRPAELARKLDLLVTSTTPVKVLETFKSVIAKVPTPTLLQVLANFRIRASLGKDIRIIMPKGNLAKVKVLDETRTHLNKDVADSVIAVIRTELKNRFKKLPKLDRVYVDANLDEYVVPFSQRSASKSLETIVRGSRVDLGDEPTVRMFCHWKEPKGHRTDIDLSAMMFDENWNFKEHVSWTNYHGRGGYEATHSGDIQSAPNGAAEYIDLNKKSIVKAGGRYVVMNVYSYTGQPLVDLPECFAGIMGREKPVQGEIFDARTVKQRFDLTADSSQAMPMILDLVDNKMIWADIAVKNAGRHRSVHNSNKSVALMGKALSRMADFKPNIGELLRLHGEARGVLVEKPELADTVFDASVSKDTEKIMSEFLT